MKISSFIAGFLIIFLTSCDPFRGSFVANRTNEKTKVNVKYNQNNERIKSYVRNHNGFGNFVKFIKDYQGSGGKLIAIDSSKYIATFEIEQKDTLEIWGGIRQSSNFDEIDEIVIRSNEKQTTIKGENFQDIFLEEHKGFYIYTIK